VHELIDRKLVCGRVKQSKAKL